MGALHAGQKGVQGAFIGPGMAIACLDFSKFGKFQKVRGEKTTLGSKIGPFLMQKTTLTTSENPNPHPNGGPNRLWACVPWPT